MITVLAKHPAWGAADNFYRAFKSCGYETTLLCLRKDPYGRTTNEVTLLNRNNLIPILSKTNFLLICSPVIITSICKKIDKNFEKTLRDIDKKVIFITGTDYIKNYKKWNKSLNKMGFKRRFCEAEMIKFNPKINMFLPHPMEYYIPIIKNEVITISHAPGIVERPEKKGTNIILSVINKLKEKYSFQYDHIVGVQLKECLNRKSKSHIFIDQVNPKVGGIGKNGYEALSLNCITMASVNSFNDIPKKERPPVINVNNETELFDSLSKFLSNKKIIEDQINKIASWKENLSFKNTVNKVLRET